MQGNRMIQPLVSIIIPIYNVENYIEECLQSVLKQTYTQYEVVLSKEGGHCIRLSGRDEFIVSALVVFQQFAELSQIFMGFGRSGLGNITKDSMEVDPVDMYFWFGISGIAMFLLLATVFFRISYLATRHKGSLWGPSVLVINIALFRESMIAGHIITTGIPAPSFGLINGMAYADLCLLKKTQNNRCNKGIETK